MSNQISSFNFSDPKIFNSNNCNDDNFKLILNEIFFRNLTSIPNSNKFHSLSSTNHLQAVFCNKEFINNSPIEFKKVSPKRNGEFDLSLDTLQTGNVIFHDGTYVIAEIFCDINKINILANPDIVINFKKFSTFQDVVIQVGGTVNFDSSFESKTLRILAKHVNFFGKVSLEHSLDIEVHGSVRFHKSVIADSVSVISDDFESFGFLNVLNNLQVHTKNKIHIKGNIKSKNDIDLKSDFVSFLGKRVQCANLNIISSDSFKNNSQVDVSQQFLVDAKFINLYGSIRCKKDVIFLAQNTFFSDESSLLSIHGNLFFEGKNCLIKGQFKVLEQSSIFTELLSTSNKFYLSGKIEIHSKKFILYQGSLVKILASSESKIVLDELFGIEKQASLEVGISSDYKNPNSNELPISLSVPNFDVLGVCKIDSTKVDILNNVNIRKNAFLKVSYSNIFSDNFLIDGKIDVLNSNLHLVSFEAKKSCDLSVIHSNIQTSKVFTILGASNFEKVFLKGYGCVILKGFSIFNECGFNSEAIYFEPNSIQSKKLLISSEIFEIIGQENLSFDQVFAYTKRLKTSGVLNLNQSKIVAKDNHSSENLGKLTLQDSLILSNGRFFNSKEGEIFVLVSDEKVGGMKADNFNNHGDAKFDKGSILEVKVFNQLGKKIDALRAKIKADKRLFIEKGSSFSVKSPEFFNIKNIVAEGDLEVRGDEEEAIKEQVHSMLYPSEKKSQPEQNSPSSAAAAASQKDPNVLENNHISYLYQGEDSKVKIEAIRMNIDVLRSFGDLETKFAIIKMKNAIFQKELKTKDSFLHSTEKSYFLGQSTAEKTYLKFKECKIYSSSKVQLDGQSRYDSDLLHLDGLFSVNNRQVQAGQENFLNLNVGTLYSSANSNIQAFDLNAKIDAWHHQGICKVDHLLHAHGAFGSYLVNKGRILSSNIDLGFDLVWNHVNSLIQGDETLRIKSGLSLNFFGRLSSHSLQQTGLANFNYGLQDAWHDNQNSILSFNMGLKIPRLSFENIFSRENLGQKIFSGVKTLGGWLLPNFKAGFDFLYGAYHLIPAIKKFSVNSIYNSKDLLTGSAPIHQYADFLNQAYGLVQSGSNLYSLLPISKKQGHDLEPSQKRNQDNFQSNPIYTSVAAAAAFIGPSFSEQSLASVNAGAVVSNNINQTDVYSKNLGFKTAIDSLNIDSKYQSNVGSISAIFGSANLRGKDFENFGNIHAGTDVNLNYKNVDLKAESQELYRAWNIDKCENLNIFGRHAFEQSKMAVANLNLQPSNSQDGVKLTKGTEVIAYSANVNMDLRLESKSVLVSDTVYQNADISLSGAGTRFIASGTHTMGEGVNFDVLNEAESFAQNQNLQKDAKIHLSQKAQNTVGHTQTINESAHINIEGGSSNLVFDQKLDGSLKANGSDSSNIVMNHLEIAKTGSIEILDDAYSKAKSILLEGKSLISNAALVVDEKLESTKDSQNTLSNGHIQAGNFNDSSLLKYSGSSSIFANEYKHNGNIEVDRDKQPSNILFVDAQKVQLDGRASMESVSFKVDHFIGDHNAFALGLKHYERYEVSDSFHFITQEDLHLTDLSHRSCDMYLEGRQVVCEAQFNKDFDLALVASVGNISIHKLIDARNFFADAAQSISVLADINAKFAVGMQARGIGGGGDIEVFGKTIRGGDYAQLIAQRDIILSSNETEYRAKFDRRIQYHPASIQGGSGEGLDGVSVHLKANRHLNIDASEVLGVKDIVLEGKEGVFLKARSYSYISRKKTEKGILGFGKKKIKEYDTEVAIAKILSQEGQNIICSTVGGIEIQAAELISAKGQDLYADKDVKLFSIIKDHKTSTSEKSFWGLSKQYHKEKHQSSTPTILLDDGFTRIHSNSESILSRGTLFLGDGDISFNAAKDIHLTKDILNHSTTSKSYTISASFFGLSALRILREGGNLWDALSSEDPLLGKVHALLDSDSFLSYAANSSNAAISAFNSLNSLCKSIDVNSVGAGLLERYGLGGKEGFNPSISLSASKTTVSEKYQTVGTGAVNKRNIEMQAGNAIRLESDIDVTENASLKSKTIEMKGTALESKYDKKTKSINISAKVTDAISGGGVSYSHNKQKQQRFENVHLNAKHLDIESDELNMKAANISADTGSMNVKKVFIETLQDKTKSSNKSYSASTSGSVSVHVSKQKNAITGEKSSIEIKEGINHEKQTVSIEELHLHGASVTSGGIVNDFAKNIVAKEKYDFEKGKGFGFSANVHDFARLGGDSKPNSGSLTQSAIATAGISLSKTDFKARHDATIYGARGTNIDRNRVDGPLNTKDPDGYEVLKNSRESINLDIPLTNKHYLNEASANIGQIVKKILPEKPISEQPIYKLNKFDLDAQFPELAAALSKQIQKNRDNFKGLLEGQYAHHLARSVLQEMDFSPEETHAILDQIEKYNKKNTTQVFQSDGNSAPDWLMIMGINGVNTDLEKAKDHMNYQKQFALGYQIQFLFNKTNGIVEDLLECVLNEVGFSPNTADLIAEEILKFHQKNIDNPDVKCLLTPHSQGTFHVRNALLKLPEEIRQRVVVRAFGPATIIPKELCFSVEHYAVKNDPIPVYAQLMFEYRTSKQSVEMFREHLETDYLLERLNASKQEINWIEPYQDYPQGPLHAHDSQNPALEAIRIRIMREHIEKNGKY